MDSIEHAYIVLKLSGVTPICKCNNCDVSPTFRGWNKGFNKFVDGHNGHIYTTYTYDDAKLIAEKRAKKLRGQPGWSRGLTKETSPSIKKAAETRSKTVTLQFLTGERQVWNKGLTKETSTSIAESASKLVDRYRSGELVPWAKGKTKLTDDRILKMSYSVAQTMKRKDVRKRLDSLKRLSPSDIHDRLKHHAPDLILISDIKSYTRDKHNNLQFMCAQCRHIQTKSLLAALSNRCDKCNPYCSKQQIEINRFIDSLGVATDTCTRFLVSPSLCVIID